MKIFREQRARTWPLARPRARSRLDAILADAMWRNYLGARAWRALRDRLARRRRIRAGSPITKHLARREWRRQAHMVVGIKLAVRRRPPRASRARFSVTRRCGALCSRRIATLSRGPLTSFGRRAKGPYVLNPPGDVRIAVLDLGAGQLTVSEDRSFPTRSEGEGEWWDYRGRMETILRERDYNY
jgi:hypothetical protein